MNFTENLCPTRRSRDSDSSGGGIDRVGRPCCSRAYAGRRGARHPRTTRGHANKARCSRRACRANDTSTWAPNSQARVRLLDHEQALVETECTDCWWGRRRRANRRLGGWRHGSPHWRCCGSRRWICIQAISSPPLPLSPVRIRPRHGSDATDWYANAITGSSTWASVLVLFTDLSRRISTMDERLSGRIDVLVGVINELDRRLTRVEIKLGIQP